MLIFAGAGASTAVDAKQYPTTLGFFERLPASIKNHKAFQQASLFIKDQRRQDGMDIEDILWTLGELVSHLQRAANPSTFPGWLYSKNHFDEAFNRPARSTQYAPQIVHLCKEIETLRDTIHTMVYDLYSQEPDEKQLENNWLYLLERLEANGETPQIFTTNYDIIIEDALEMMAKRLKRPCGVDRGLCGHSQKILDVERWHEESSHTAPLFTKLHGSVDWEWKQRRAALEISRIGVGGTVFKGSHEKHAIIYPGFKGAPKDEPFTLFHEHLSRCLMAGGVAVFIGFAFRDDHINGLVRQAYGVLDRIVVINKGPQIELPFSMDKVDYYSDGFSRPSVDALMMSLDSDR